MKPITLDSIDIRSSYHDLLGHISDLFGNLAEGAFAVDQHANLIWANEPYLKLIGVPDQADVIGMPISDLVEDTLMSVVVQTGRAIPLDILEVHRQRCIVSRFPVTDAESGVVVGGVCIILADNLQPLTAMVGRVPTLQEELKGTKYAFEKVRLSKYGFSKIIGKSPNILEVKRQAQRAATCDTTVLLSGETGTGKELIAQAIHATSLRAAHNFVGINVAAVPEDLVEAEFFGVAPGAYTGANSKGRIGKMALANGGTLFLDEIADMPLRIQVKLLRALQEREIEPVGSNAVTKLNIRLIAASSKDLFQMVKLGKFRADLYYRLNVIPIYMPPLRERIEDMPLLVDALLEEVCKCIGVSSKEMDESALEFLQSRSWPGNVRELRNIIERACVLTSGPVISRRDLVALEEDESAPSPVPNPTTSSKLTRSVADVEKELIAQTMGETHGNKMLAAKKLGISRSNLYKKLELYHLSDAFAAKGELSTEASGH